MRCCPTIFGIWRDTNDFLILRWFDTMKLPTGNLLKLTVGSKIRSPQTLEAWKICPRHARSLGHEQAPVLRNKPKRTPAAKSEWPRNATTRLRLSEDVWRCRGVHGPKNMEEGVGLLGNLLIQGSLSATRTTFSKGLKAWWFFVACWSKYSSNIFSNRWHASWRYRWSHHQDRIRLHHIYHDWKGCWF